MEGSRAKSRAERGGQIAVELLFGVPPVQRRDFDLGIGRAVAALTPSPARADRNEDALLVARLPRSTVIAVADGVGGLPGGDLAARSALEVLSGFVEQAATAEPDGLRDAVLRGFDAADAAVDSMQGATTLTVVELWPGAFRTYHAGDTAALVVDASGRDLYRTVSHSPVGYALEAGLLDESDALRHGARHVISNCLGQGGARIELSPLLELSARRRIVVASDGLFDNLSISEVTGVLAGFDLPTACERLVDETAQRMGGARPEAPCKPDDLGLILFEPYG